MMFTKKPELPPNDFVSCHDCKLLLREEDAQKVVVIGSYRPSLRNEQIHYFCPAHKKAYDEVKNYPLVGNDYVKYRVAVDKDGTPIGYKKINEK